MGTGSGGGARLPETPLGSGACPHFSERSLEIGWSSRWAADRPGPPPFRQTPRFRPTEDGHELHDIATGPRRRRGEPLPPRSMGPGQAGQGAGQGTTAQGTNQGTNRGANVNNARGARTTTGTATQPNANTAQQPALRGQSVGRMAQRANTINAG